MTLDVSVPEPPDLSNRGAPSDFEWDEETLGGEDFHREEFEDLLQEGAWEEGFNEWAQYTDLDERQVRAVDDLGLFQAFDFYRDPTEGRYRFEAPTVPDDWRERDAAGALDPETVSLIDDELRDLGRAVHEVLEDYLEGTEEPADDWDAEAYGQRDE